MYTPEPTSITGDIPIAVGSMKSLWGWFSGSHVSDALPVWDVINSLQSGACNPTTVPVPYWTASNHFVGSEVFAQAWQSLGAIYRDIVDDDYKAAIGTLIPDILSQDIAVWFPPEPEGELPGTLILVNGDGVQFYYLTNHPTVSDILSAFQLVATSLQSDPAKENG